MKYNQRQAPLPKESRLYPKIHPIWRGVGFALMILTPIMAFAATEIFLADNAVKNYVKIPSDLYLICPGKDILATVLCRFSSDPLLQVKIISTLFISFIFLIFLQFVFFITMRIVAPSRYGPMDVPPITYKGRPYKR